MLCDHSIYILREFDIKKVNRYGDEDCGTVFGFGEPHTLTNDWRCSKRVNGEKGVVRWFCGVFGDGSFGFVLRHQHDAS